jgi:hypothetical protein
MAEYFLKAPDGTKVYRITYTVDASQSPERITIVSVHLAGPVANLPTGRSGAAMDEPCDVQNPLIDLILAAVVPATLADYRAACKAVVDTLWA